jgi:hypothetical protein
MSELPSRKDKTFLRLAVRKIGQSATAFNEWRIGQKHRWLKLTECNFDGLTLDGVDFHGIKFTGSSFRGAFLKSANFVSANLNKVDFTDAKLANADFQGARMSETILDGADVNWANMNQTLHDSWSIKGIKCERCWITKARIEAPNLPEQFKPGEFEAIYGGTKVRVIFADGFQPIDLLALPFYVKSFADKFAGKHLVFVGLNTLETPSLEFRVENKKIAEELSGDMQHHLDREAAVVRQTMIRQLENKDSQISALIGSLNAALEKIKGTHMIINNTNTGPTLIQESGIQAASMVGNNIKEINFGDATHMAELVKQLQSMIEKLPTRSDATAQNTQLLLEATTAAQANDEPGVRHALKKAGGWLLKFANDVGVSLVADAIKQSMGIK